jgi:hypothetical protein
MPALILPRPNLKNTTEHWDFDIRKCHAYYIANSADNLAPSFAVMTVLSIIASTLLLRED